MRENRQISIQLDQRFNRVLAERNITGVQAHALLYVLQQAGEGASVTTLHQVSGSSKATISHLVKRLREKGYVRVELCPEDDRRRLLFGTEQGRQLQAALETSFQTCLLYTSHQQNRPPASGYPRRIAGTGAPPG